MLRDRSEPLNVFDYGPQLTMAMDPVLARLDELLEDDELFQAVKRDRSQRKPRTLKTGRPSNPVEVALRGLVVRRLYGWSYEETEQWVGDSRVLRQFCRVDFELAPDDTALIRWANLIQPETLHQVLEHVVQIARDLKVTRGRPLRIDGTVGETHIHYPTDSGLLGDGVRVLGRMLERAQPWLKEGAHWTEQAKTWMQQARSAVRPISDLARQRREAARRGPYARSITAWLRGRRPSLPRPSRG